MSKRWRDGSGEIVRDDWSRKVRPQDVTEINLFSRGIMHRDLLAGFMFGFRKLLLLVGICVVIVGVITSAILVYWRRKSNRNL